MAEEMRLAQVFEPLARTLYNSAAAWAVVLGAPLIGATWLEQQPAAGLALVQPMGLVNPRKPAW